MFRRPEELPAVAEETTAVAVQSTEENLSPVHEEAQGAKEDEGFFSKLFRFLSKAPPDAVQEDMDRRVNVEKRASSLLRRLK